MSETNTKDVTVWNTVLNGALLIPGARVDRDAYLRKELTASGVSSELVDLAIETTPAKAGVPAGLIHKIAQGSIRMHRTGVSATSLAAGLPGGFLMVATVPGDMTQFFWHVIVIMQKLVYLHGWPELLSGDEEVGDDTRHLLTIFAGVMFGAQGANAALSKVADMLAKEVVIRLPREKLTKWGVYILSKEIAKWIGIKLTKEGFARGVAKVVPILGGAVAGGITWVTYSSMCKRLHMHLQEQVQHSNTALESATATPR